MESQIYVINSGFGFAMKVVVVGGGVISNRLVAAAPPRLSYRASQCGVYLMPVVLVLRL